MSSVTLARAPANHKAPKPKQSCKRIKEIFDPGNESENCCKMNLKTRGASCLVASVLGLPFTLHIQRGEVSGHKHGPGLGLNG